MSKIPNRFDVRVIERNIKKGAISEDDLKAHLKALPDALEKGVKVGTNEELDADEFTADSK